ncbi:MTOR-associated protein MEAK7 [Halyomorpha halys]|uniref:MTOR-associated protein MEAK7 n=1 Tax=Halyomorpha halys TaxID=286706 RepID=UPI0006D50A17|nr:TLD domain-containing protein 1-like [Halyomorpha halys]
MGATDSKRKLTDSCLTEKQKSNILKLFDVRGRGRGTPVTDETLQSVWKGVFSEGLLTIILRFLFKTTKEVYIDDMELFFYHLVEGSTRERAELLVALLGIENSIPPRSFQIYVSYLMESYMMILQKEHPETFSIWVTADLTEKSDIAVVSKFLINDIEYVEGRIESSELEKWLLRCGFYEGIFTSVMNYAFNMEVEQLSPVLPKLDKMSSLLRVPTALALSYLTNTSGREDWRLLYSSSSDASSWNIIHRKINEQGPTVILIQDAAGPLFGGYASQSWKISPNFYGDERSFLFRLRPEMSVCYPTSYNKNFQYMNDGTATLPNGLGMGGQLNYFGFFLSSDYGVGSVSKTCTTFGNYIPLASQYDFRFTRLEIWGIGDPEDKTASAKAKQDKLVMERDPAAQALLEMMGKAGHSKNLPDPY